MSKKSEKKKSPGFMGSLIAIILKSAKLLKVIKLFKVAKPLILFISMSISVVAYTFMMGPWMAILFVILLLIHEMGHIAAMKMKGLKTGTPVFIPFLGAAIFAPKFKTRHIEAFVGYGGPLLGTLASLAVFGLVFLMPKGSKIADILLAGSYLGTFLNAFNLLPISPLDGGRITQATGTWFRYIGLICLAMFSVLFRQPVILYVWILVLFDLTMLPKKIRAFLATTCWIAMATLMYKGYSNQGKYIDILDCVITLFFVMLMVVVALANQEIFEEDKRPNLTPEWRFKWFALYSILLLSLIAILLLQFQLLPRHH